MIPLHRRAFVAGSALCLFATGALAHGFQAGKLAIQHPWSRETAAGQAVGGGFMVVANKGKAADRLVSATTPVAAEVQLHSMTMDGGIMRMRRVEGGMAIPAGGTLALAPGGYHLMFMGLKRRLQQGERFPVTLRFQRSGTVTVQFAVEAAGFAGPGEKPHAGH